MKFFGTSPSLPRGRGQLTPEQIARLRPSALAFKRSSDSPMDDATMATEARLDFSQHRCADLAALLREKQRDTVSLAKALNELQAQNDALRVSRGLPSLSRARAVRDELVEATATVERLSAESNLKDARAEELLSLLQSLQQGLVERVAATERTAEEHVEEVARLTADAGELRSLRSERHAAETKLRMVRRKLQAEGEAARAAEAANAQLAAQLAAAEKECADAVSFKAAADAATRALERAVVEAEQRAAAAERAEREALRSLAAASAERDALRAAAQVAARRDEDLSLLAQQLVHANDAGGAKDRELASLRAQLCVPPLRATASRGVDLGEDADAAKAMLDRARLSRRVAAPLLRTPPMHAHSPASRSLLRRAKGGGGGEARAEKQRQRQKQAPPRARATDSPNVADAHTSSSRAKRWHVVVDEAEDGGVLNVRRATPRATPRATARAAATGSSPRRRRDSGGTDTRTGNAPQRPSPKRSSAYRAHPQGSFQVRIATGLSRPSSASLRRSHVCVDK